MNNKHLIKELREILVKNFDLIPGSTVVQHTEDQLLALILSEKKDLINKVKDIFVEDWMQIEARIDGESAYTAEELSYYLEDFKNYVLSQLVEVKE